MAAIITFSNQEKTTHNSHKFAFTLKPTNYGHWRSMLESFLTSHNLFGYVDETVPCPAQKVTNESATTDNPSYLPWISNDAHIRLLIISTVSEESYQHVQGKTSREVWLSLEQAYAPVTSSHEFTLKSQLLRITMKGDEKPADYLSRAQEYATALANIGEPMKDKDLVMLAITGLREEYSGLKSNLLTRSLVVFRELHGLISDHDYMIKRVLATTPQALLSTAAPVPQTMAPQPLMAATFSTPQPNLDQLQQQFQNLQLMASQMGYQLNPVSSSTPQAYYGSRSFNNRGGRSSHGYSRGNSRGASNSRNRGNTSTSGGSGTSGGTRQFSWASTQNTVYGHCNRCGIGHLPSQCPNQPHQSRSTSQVNYATYSDAASSSGSTWKPDTGATNHATPDLSGLDNFAAYNGRVYTHYPPDGPQ